jgi:hypothetical protein
MTVTDALSKILEIHTQFADILQSQYVTTIPLCEMAVNFNGETHFACKNRITVRTSSRDQVASTYPHKQHLTDSLLRYLLHVIVTPSAHSHRHIKYFITTKFTGRKPYF